MRSRIRVITLLSIAMATSAAAQGRGERSPRAEGRPSGAPAAQLLLSNTGELQLTDAQVVRLAAIARRSESRRQALRSSLDSARGRFTQPGDSIARRQFAQRMRTDALRAREQMQVDQRDAIAVLTPDQQAKAWERVANRGRDMGARDMGARDMRARGGRGMGRGGDMQRGMRGRPPMMRDRMGGDRPMRQRDRVPMPAPRPPEGL